MTGTGEAAQQFDAVVVGGGPGGYVAAIHGAQLGLKVALVERDQLGGTCLNRGCIPTKALVKSAELYQKAQKGMAEFGVTAEGVRLDFAQVMRRKQKVVAALVGGVGQLMKANGVTVFSGEGRVSRPGVVEVAAGPGQAPAVLQTRRTVIATGSVPAMIPVPGLDLPGVVTSDQLLDIQELPASMVVIGGGVIGAEFASIFAAFGTRVAVVEMLPALLPIADGEVSRRLALAFRRQGIEVYTAARVTAVEAAPGSSGDDTPFGPEKVVLLEVNGAPQELRAEVVLVAVGRRPNLQGIDAGSLGVATTRAGIQVNDRMQTSCQDVYAIGDVNGLSMLAHSAFAQGIVAMDTIAGRDHRWGDQVVPAAVFTHPEVAWAGLTEEAARAQGIPVAVARFPFAASGKAQVEGETDGFVKLVAEAAGGPEGSAAPGRLLGVHILGPLATELIHEGVLAVQQGVRAAELAEAIHAHPTLAEAVGEAAHLLLGTPVHIARR